MFEVQDQDTRVVGFWWGSLVNLQMVTFSLYPHIGFPLCIFADISSSSYADAGPVELGIHPHDFI